MLAHAQIVFWDFDGVIKESVDVKTEAFARLFAQYGRAVEKRVRDHHVANGGMSRFEKIPQYLRFAGEEVNADAVDDYCARFAGLVLQGVIDSPWVPGVQELFKNKRKGTRFVLVSATPQSELEHIVGAAGIAASFSAIYGAPTRKAVAIATELQNTGCDPARCLMIGDALADFEAAAANGVPFLLRRHETNKMVFLHYTGPSINDFTKL